MAALLGVFRDADSPLLRRLQAVGAMSIGSRTLVVRASDDKLIAEAADGGKRTTSGPDPKKYQVKDGQLGQVRRS